MFFLCPEVALAAAVDRLSAVEYEEASVLRDISPLRNV
jgi:hypothetical protein